MRHNARREATLESIGMEPFALLHRHSSGDRHVICDDDLVAISNAVKSGERVFTAYFLTDGKIRIWVTTDTDRPSTAILLPDEY